MLRAQCLSRRIPDRTTLEHEIAAWEQQRNESGARITWFFDLDRARQKFARRYPAPATTELKPPKLSSPQLRQAA